MAKENYQYITIVAIIAIIAMAFIVSEPKTMMSQTTTNQQDNTAGKAISLKDPVHTENSEEELQCGDSIEGYYFMSENLDCSDYEGQASLYLQSESTLDCQGHTIYGNDVQDYTLSVYEKDDIMIKNCKLEGFKRGIWLRNSYDVVIDNNEFIPSSYFGATIEVKLSNAIIKNNVLKQTEFNSTSAQSGIILSNHFSREVVLSNNKVSGYRTGVYTSSYHSGPLTLENNVLCNNNVDFESSINLTSYDNTCDTTEGTVDICEKQCHETTSEQGTVAR